MCYNISMISNYIINRSIDLDKPVDNLKLQKLLYLTDRAFLDIKDKRCFENEIIFVRHGPIVKTIYRKYRLYSNQPILVKEKTYKELIIDESFTFSYIDREFSYSSIDRQDRMIIDDIVIKYLNLDAWDITELMQKNY